jgi:ABC-2 type transport system permease protein
MVKRLISKKNRALLSELVRTDFKLRYQGSVLGYTWSLLRPLMIFLILYVVFVKFIKLGGDVPHYPIYLLFGIVLWNFFAEMTNLSLTSIVGRGDLIRKIRIPRWIIVLSSSITALINLGLNLIVVLVFMIINRVDLLQTALWIPLILIEIYIFALGVSLFLAAAYVKYRDISYIWEVIMQGLFYLTPIIYPLSIIPNLTFKKIILMNPIAQATQDARYSLITHRTETISQIFDGGWYRFLPFVFVAVALVVGTLYFKREAKYFAENL